MLEKVKRERIPYQIASQIRELILTGKLLAGQSLPHEKELVAELEVSRQTLREALRILEAIGLIEVRKGAGGGAFVVKMGSDKLCETISNFLFFRDLSLRHLGEIRKLTEPYYAKIAAERLSPDELEKLRALNRECEEMITRGEDIVGGRSEVEFHSILARSTENPVMMMIEEFVSFLMIEMKIALKPDIKFSEKILTAHRRILKALEERDGAAAATEMYSHVCEVNEILHKLETTRG